MLVLAAGATALAQRQPALQAVRGTAGVPRRPDVPERGPEPGGGPGRGVTLVAAGDVLGHGVVEASARRHAAQGGFRWVLGAVGRAAASADVAFVNLETPLTTRYRPLDTRRWPPTLGGDPALAEDLAGLGFDVVSVANNHALDQTPAGLAETVERLVAAGLHPLGAGPSVEEAFAPRVLERRGVRVAFLAFTHPMNPVGDVPVRRVVPHGRMLVARLWDRERVRAALARARESADVVVASVHWGTEQADAPGRQELRRARELVEDGADVVLGHGPHRLQPVVRLSSPRGDALVAYSLGNLLSNMGYRYRRGMRLDRMTHPSNGHPGNRDGVLLQLELRVPSPGRVALGPVAGVPLWTDNVPAGGQRDVQVLPLAEVPSPLREERLEAIRAALGSEVQLAP